MTLSRLPARLLLAVSLPLLCALGFLVNYLIVVFGLVTVLVLLFADKARLRPDLPGTIFGLVFLALAFTYVIAARQPADMLMVFNVLVFALYPAYAAVLAPRARPDATTVVGLLSFAGVCVAAILALVDSFIFDASRAGYIVSDPIRLANSALILSTFAFVAGFRLADRRLLLLRFAPLLALLVIILAGARTALIIFAPIYILALLLAMPTRRTLLTLGGIFLLAAAGLAAALALGYVPDRIVRLPGLLWNALQGGEIPDRSLAERLELYRTGWLAFLDSPLVGHGWANISAAIKPHAIAGYKDIMALPHLHNDLITMAVSSGLFGIVAYFALLALPVVAAARSPRDSQYRARLQFALLLAGSYALLGLADTMLIFELHMTIYVVLSAIILAFMRNRPEPADR